MGRPLLASVVINNYNYACFLRDAVDSALHQTHSRTEVIVVDDGSTDDSRDILGAYGSRILPLLKENGGQASALNAGFAASQGDVVVFLDADDLLLPGAVAAAVHCFEEPGVTKVQWPLWEIDAEGARTGAVKPPCSLPEGDLRGRVLKHGPTGALPSAPTSGNAWSREFLQQVLPMPEEEFRICADSYLFVLAAAFGPIRSLAEPQGLFRRHVHNRYQGKTFAEKVRLGFSGYLQQWRALTEFYRCHAIAVNPQTWEADSWWPRLNKVVQALTELVPEGDTFLLVDEDQWTIGGTVAGRRCLPFPERDGCYWGPPADDAAAIEELERQRRSGARFIAFGWPAFWWLEYYSGFHDYLRARFRRCLANDLLVVFDLRVPIRPVLAGSTEVA